MGYPSGAHRLMTGCLSPSLRAGKHLMCGITPLHLRSIAHRQSWPVRRPGSPAEERPDACITHVPHVPGTLAVIASRCGRSDLSAANEQTPSFRSVTIRRSAGGRTGRLLTVQVDAGQVVVHAGANLAQRPPPVRGAGGGAGAGRTAASRGLWEDLCDRGALPVVPTCRCRRVGMRLLGKRALIGTHSAL